MAMLFKFNLYFYLPQYTTTFDPVKDITEMFPYNIKTSKSFYLNLKKEDVVGIGKGPIYFQKIKLGKLEVILTENISKNILKNFTLEEGEIAVFILDNNEIERFEKFMEVEPGTFSSELLREELEK